MASAPSMPRRESIQRIRTALIEKKMTQAELADAADCHEKTIQNMLAGRTVRDQTLFDVAMVLGLDYERLRDDWNGQPPKPDRGEALDEAPGERVPGSDVAPLYMGAYTRAGVDHLVGSYLTVRPAFAVADLIIAYRTDITWDESWPSLLFEERNRPDGPYAHRGRLHVPASSPFLHLVSLTKGAMRMVTLSQIDQLGQMRGIITTISRQRAMLVPVGAPIVYERGEVDEGGCGEIGPGHACYERYRGMIEQTVAQGFARLIGG